MASLLLAAVLAGCGAPSVDVDPGAGDAGAGGEADSGAPALDAGFDAGPGSPNSDAGPGADAGAPDCVGRDAGVGGQDWTLVHEGRTRSFRVHVPQSYRRDRFTPVVFNFHGYTSDSAAQEFFSDMTPLAEDAGFIVVYGNGTRDNVAYPGYFSINPSWNAGGCCAGSGRDAGNVDDVGYVGELIDLLSERLCVDERRIFATGYSNGGMLSHRLACELSDRIAAVAPVAGPNATEYGGLPCTPPRPVPVMHFHGTADAVVPYAGSATPVPFEAAPVSVSRWAQRNGCGTSTTVEVVQANDSHCERYQGCPDGGDVVLCTVIDGGHNWPGGKVPGGYPGGYTTPHLRASDEMWKFFRAHPRP